MASNLIHSVDLRGLQTFAEDYPGAECRLLYQGRETLDLEGITCQPVADFLATLQPLRVG